MKDEYDVTIWLSPDTVQWFRDQVQGGGSFQDLINEALETHIKQQKEGSANEPRQSS
jgi:uncharacterized protein (DUF4415 family)